MEIKLTSIDVSCQGAEGFRSSWLQTLGNQLIDHPPYIWCTNRKCYSLYKISWICYVFFAQQNIDTPPVEEHMVGLTCAKLTTPIIMTIHPISGTVANKCISDASLMTFVGTLMDPSEIMIPDGGSFSSYLQAAVEVSKRSPELIQLLDMHMHFAASTPGRKVLRIY